MSNHAPLVSRPPLILNSQNYLLVHNISINKNYLTTFLPRYVLEAPGAKIS